MAKTKTKTSRTTARAPRVTAKRVHFSIRTIRNANPRHLRTASRAGRVLSRFFSL